MATIFDESGFAIGDCPEVELRFPVLGTPEWGQMNQRRVELIEKDWRRTVDEDREYESLQRHVETSLDRIFPFEPPAARAAHQGSSPADGPDAPGVSAAETGEHGDFASPPATDAAHRAAGLVPLTWDDVLMGNE